MYFFVFLFALVFVNSIAIFRVFSIARSNSGGSLRDQNWYNGGSD